MKTLIFTPINDYELLDAHKAFDTCSTCIPVEYELTRFLVKIESCAEAQFIVNTLAMKRRGIKGSWKLI
jgi:hypothetical protein